MPGHGKSVKSGQKTLNASKSSKSVSSFGVLCNINFMNLLSVNKLQRLLVNVFCPDLTPFHMLPKHQAFTS